MWIGSLTQIYDVHSAWSWLCLRQIIWWHTYESTRESLSLSRSHFGSHTQQKPSQFIWMIQLNTLVVLSSYTGYHTEYFWFVTVQLHNLGCKVVIQHKVRSLYSTPSKIYCTRKAMERKVLKRYCVKNIHENTERKEKEMKRPRERKKERKEKRSDDDDLVFSWMI